MKVYARCKTIYDEHAGKVPYNVNISMAVEGFHEMGFEIYFYNKIDEIYDDFQFGDILLDGISQVEYILKKFNIVLQNENYPDVLLKYMSRKVWKDTINNINTHPELWGNFVKPIKDKAFTGHIINGPKDLIGCGNEYEDYEVLVSQPVEFVYECRGFVYYDKLIDLRPYKGNYEYMQYMDTNIIKQAMKDWKTWEDRPMVCSLDWGVIKIKKQECVEYKTVFIEQNSFSATACYGLYHIDYAKMISAYFATAYNIEDECHFGVSFM